MKLIIASGLVLAGLTGGAFAADLIVDEPAAAPVVASDTSWDGFYLGANVGYGWAEAESDGFGPTTDTIDLDGFTVGGQIGYNFTLSGNVVLGLEGDLNWTNLEGSVAFPDDGNYEANETIDWTGAVTGKIGLALDSVMPYFLGGVAFAHNTLSYYDNDLDAQISEESQTHIGYTVGLGLAAKVSDSVSVFGEYRFSDYGSKEYGTDTGDVSLTSNTIRAGVNFHF